jgi:hypothetical protein
MDIISAYQQVGSYWGAAELCGTTHRTVKRVVERSEAGGPPPPRVERVHNYDPVSELVAEPGGQVSGADVGEAVVADRAGCRLRRFGA